MPRKPVYEQVIDDIVASVRSGMLKPGDRLPTIAQFAQQYSSSDYPIRRALWILDERGWIEVHQGKGSFVAPKPPA
ncbi:winged helix-turn-helix domain-containing protein [Micromonospora sp. RL09-050-HVF-A]|uniref:winged helix-turn-helix domain-containing protein n=1 Tax=Micromonospora sp. RL09-050-HVF-A TaxID=1703433 RepID=UPI001C5F0BED|nr:winged helix-turn-helix domain-containing protein [Micromonospora sp. RL09-050-HVF-A]MBW4705876.1 winged helix-turn-helix transcriptional regulator [Micromonospora sp. RL09-050-HVF-A]